MISNSFLRRNRIRFASAVIVVLAAASLIAYAISSEGYAVHHAPLNDGGVWVAGSSYGEFAQVNKPVGQFAGATYLGNAAQDDRGDNLQIVQAGAAAVAVNSTSGKLAALNDDTLSAPSSTTTSIPTGADVAVGGTSDAVIAVLDPSSGKLWATHADVDQPTTDVSALNRSSKPLVKLAAPASIAVSVNGTIFAATGSGTLVAIKPTPAGFAAPTTSHLGRFAQQPTVTAVGDEAVVLAGRTAYFDSGRTAALPVGAVLQQPGPADSAVLFSDPNGLSSVRLNDAAITSLSTSYSGTVPVAPVRTSSCVYAAWTQPATYRTACAGNAAVHGSVDSTATTLAFRANREQVVLNDPRGPVWNVDTSKALRIDDWPAVTPRTAESQQQKQRNDAGDAANPPVAKPDNLEARAGRTTVLHVLDNDTRPPGDIIAIDPTLTGQSNTGGTTLAVSADEQTIAITLPASATRPVRFTYGITDVHHSKPVTAPVTVTPVSSGDTKPYLCTCAQLRTWSVGASSVIDIPVTGDWRDKEGDPVTLVSSTASAGTSSVTSDGDILYTASDAAGKVTVKYTVSDGFGLTNTSEEQIDVLAADATTGTKPVAQTDVAQATVGQTITIAPLANDLPGADPTTPNATLQLSQVTAPAGTTVTPDLLHGTVTFSASTAKSYLVPYSITYGIESASGEMRIDVRQPGGGSPVVALPDLAAVRSGQSTTVDLLANDYDTRGRLLVVQSATPADPNSGLQTSVVQGRYLHVSFNGTPAAEPADVTYEVTDGVDSATGFVSVSELPGNADDVPVALPDTADARSGDTALIPVLDNDIDPDGSALSLVPSSVTQPVGGGQTFQQGNAIRYVAPDVKRTTTATFTYLATNGEHQQTGSVTVTVHPLPATPAADSPPDPLPIERSVVAGGTLQITVPTSGVDPDGDSVTFDGITAPGPSLGTITATSPDRLTYVAFPGVDNAGTDVIGYRVQDRFGQIGESQIRIAVVAPSAAQAPVAVPDSINGAPGSSLAVNVVANDLVPPGYVARIRLRGETDGATIDKSNPDVIDIRAPAAGHPVSITYELSDGSGQDALTTLAVTGVDGWDNAPVAQDDTAQPSSPQANTATVAVLANDYDPDRADTLAISKVFSRNASVAGRAVRVRLTRAPQVIPYEITDGHGKSAVAVVYVPAAGTGAPYLRPGAQIKVPQGGTKSINVNDYLLDPAGKQLISTFASTISTAPSEGLRYVKARGPTLEIGGQGRYSGPASVTLQVTDGTTPTTKGATTGYVTIPVQVGLPTPVLDCPTGAPNSIFLGGKPTTVHVTSVCHVWLPNGMSAGQVQLTSKVAGAVAGIEQHLDSATQVLTVTATKAAKEGETVSVDLGVRGTPQQQELRYRVLSPPLMTLAPISGSGRNSRPTTINVAASATSPILGAQVTVTGCKLISGMASTCASHGGDVVITPGANAHGTLTFAVTATDLPNASARTVSGTITLDVIGKPAPPTNVRAMANRSIGGTVTLTWTDPAFSGGPGAGFIKDFDVTYAGGRKPCLASGCQIGGLTNGRSYTFQVTTVNQAGERSTPPATSNAATPDRKPGAVGGLTVRPGNDQVDVTWSPATDGGSHVRTYQVQYSDIGTKSPGDRGVHAVGGLAFSAATVNDDPYQFKVRAVNADGAGPWSSVVRAQSAGVPASVTGVTVPAENATEPSDHVYAQITWTHGSDPNGGPLAYYTVYRRVGGSGQGTIVCAHVSATASPTCSDGVQNDGTQYQYGVTATNSSTPTGVQHSSVITDWASFDATGIPEQVADAKVFASQGAYQAGSPDPGPQAGSGAGFDQSLKVTFTVPAANGKAITAIQYELNGDNNWQQLSTSSSLTPGATGSGTITGLTNGSSYEVALRASNGEYQGPASAPSGDEYPYGAPNTPSLDAEHTGTKVTYSWSGPSNGRDISFMISIDGGAAQQESGSASPMTVDRGYDAQYSISGYIVDSVGNQSANVTGPSGKTDDVPAPSSGNCNGSSGNSLTFNWNAPASNVQYDYNFNNQGWTDNGASTSVTKGNLNYSTTYGISVRSKDTKGHTSSAYSFTCQTANNPEFQLMHGGQCNYGGGAAAGCEYVYVRIINFPPGGSATCAAAGNGAKGWGPTTFTAGSDGTSPYSGSSGNGPLFDTNGNNRYGDGPYPMGTDDNGLTCTKN